MLLWDFGDTLVDERWMHAAPAGCPGWTAAWHAVMAEHARGWNVGSIGMPEVFEALADRTGLAPSAVASHARSCCERVAFHPAAWSAARERRRPQAIVTVNPDLFAELVVPAHGLDDVFDVLVTSCAEGTDDKVVLCERALERLGFEGPRSEALLIDNRADLVAAWEATGGAGYTFTGDDRFARDRPALFD